MHTVLSTEYLLFNLLSKRDTVTPHILNQFVYQLYNKLPNVVFDVSEDTLSYIAYLYRDKINMGYSSIALTSGTSIVDIQQLAESSFNWLYTDIQNEVVKNTAEALCFPA